MSFNSYGAETIARDKRAEARRIADGARRSAAQRMKHERDRNRRVRRVVVAAVFVIVGSALIL